MLPNPITHQIHLSLNLLVILHKKTPQTQTACFIYGLSGLSKLLFYFTLTLTYTPSVLLWGILKISHECKWWSFKIYSTNIPLTENILLMEKKINVVHETYHLTPERWAWQK